MKPGELHLWLREHEWAVSEHAYTQLHAHTRAHAYYGPQPADSRWTRTQTVGVGVRQSDHCHCWRAASGAAQRWEIVLFTSSNTPEEVKCLFQADLFIRLWTSNQVPRFDRFTGALRIKFHMVHFILKQHSALRGSEMKAGSALFCELLYRECFRWLDSWVFYLIWSAGAKDKCALGRTEYHYPHFYVWIGGWSCERETFRTLESTAGQHHDPLLACLGRIVVERLLLHVPGRGEQLFDGWKQRSAPGFHPPAAADAREAGDAEGDLVHPRAAT